MMTSGGYLKGRERRAFVGRREIDGREREMYIKTEAPHTRRDGKKKRGRRVFFTS